MAFPTSPTAGDIYQAPSGKRYEFKSSGGWSEIYPVLTGTLSYSVPGDFASPQAAVDYLRNFVLGDTCSITINVAAGSYSQSASMQGHPQGLQILVKGANKPSIVAADFQNSGNSAANHTADAPVNKAMLQSKYQTEIVATAAAALLVNYEEALRVENILFMGLSDGIASLGTTIATDCSTWGGTGYGFDASGMGIIRCSGIVTAASAAVGGFGASNGASIIAPGADVISYGNGSYGITMQVNATFLAGSIFTGGNPTGTQAAYGSSIYATDITSAKDDLGISSRFNSMIYAGNATLNSVTSYGFHATVSSVVDIDTNCSVSSNGADYAVRADLASQIRLVSLSATGSFALRNVLASNGSNIHIDNAALPAGAATSMQALIGGVISSFGVTGNVTRSPALNTVGNNNSYIAG